MVSFIRNKFKKVFFVLLVLIIGKCSLLHAKPIELRVAYAVTEQPPYFYGHTTVIPDKPGIAVDMVKNLEKRIPNLHVKFFRYPWKRCLFSLEKGEVDAIFKATYKPERIKYGAYPMKQGKIDENRKMAVLSNSLYKMKDTQMEWNGKNFSLIKGEICAPRAYYIAGVLKDNGVSVIESDSSQNCLEKLRHSRVAAVAIQDVTGTTLLKKSPKRYKDIERVRPPLTIKPQYLMLSHQFIKNHPILAEQIWDAIAQIRKEDLAHISAKYIQ